MTLLSSFAAPHLSTSKQSDGSRLATVSFTDPNTGDVYSLEATMTIDSSGTPHCDFMAHGIAIDSAMSDT